MPSRFRTAALTLSLLAGACASAPPPEDPQLVAYRRELAEARGKLIEEQTAHEAARDLLSDELEATRREVERLARERQAAQETARAHQQATQEAQVLLGAREARIAALEAELEERQNPPEGSEAAAAAVLLRQKDARIEALKDELARLTAQLSGTAPPPERRPELDGIVRVASIDLEEPVAFVDGEPISRRDFVEFLYRDLGSPGLLDLFVNRFLVVREARRRGVEVSDLDVQAWAEEQLLGHVSAAGSATAFQERLARQGFDPAAWEARLRYQARPALMLIRLVELERTTPAGREAFEARVRATYQQRWSEQVSARHVLIRLAEDAPAQEAAAAQRKAQAVAAELARGGKFEDVAKRWSDDRQSAQLGGSLGTFDRSKFAELPALNTLLFTLEPGRVSDPVRTRAGYHVVRVDERRPPARALDGELRQQLEAELRAEPPSQGELEALLARLRARAAIRTALRFD